MTMIIDLSPEPPKSRHFKSPVISAGLRAEFRVSKAKTEMATAQEKKRSRFISQAWSAALSGMVSSAFTVWMRGADPIFAAPVMIGMPVVIGVLSWWLCPQVTEPTPHERYMMMLLARIEAWRELLLVASGETAKSLGKNGEKVEHYQTLLFSLCEEWNTHLGEYYGWDPYLSVLHTPDIPVTHIHYRIGATISNDQLKELRAITAALREEGENESRNAVSTAVDTGGTNLDPKHPTRIRGSRSERTRS